MSGGTTPKEEDTTYVRAVLNGRECNLPVFLERSHLVRFFAVDPKATITVKRPDDKAGLSLTSGTIGIEPGTVVNAVVTDNA